MLKRVFLFSVLLLLSVYSGAQIYDPVTWDFDYEKKGPGEYELIFSASIEEKSHIYSIDIPAGGPIPTSFTFDTVAGVVFKGNPYEVTPPEELFDEAFELNIKTFSNKAEFRQKVFVEDDNFTISGIVTYMACDNTRCSPPKDVEFIISTAAIPGEGKLLPGSGSSAGVGDPGFVRFFLLSLLAGLAGVVTPCVFPMIPMTVAFFSGSSVSRSRAVMNALIFGISIILIYSSLGIIVSLTSAGAGFANALSTHWIPNALFFILFIVFAVSFFGGFELILPSSWITRADSRVDKGGPLASFFMGLTTVLVSFSCTGPIIGVLLVEAAAGEVIRPTIGMFGFGLAFALPFTVFALFPAILTKLPKSGGWLNSVKIVLAFIMIAFSLKFLLAIDTVYSFGLLTRTIFLAIWIVTFSLLGLYLLGAIKFNHDSEIKHVGPFRFFLVIVVFSFVIYLFTGLSGSSQLKGISSLLPPIEREAAVSYGSSSPVNQDVLPVDGVAYSDELCDVPKYSDFLSLPLGLNGYFDYKQGIECAKKTGKPVFIDFKGHTCSNCKVMEAKVWSDPRVLKRLKENFVIISLYADDRTKLAEDEWIVSKVDGKEKKTIGKLNEDIEISMFNTNALPLYVITDYEGNAVNQPMPANFNVEEYIEWLDEGLAAFRTLNNKNINVLR